LTGIGISLLQRPADTATLSSSRIRISFSDPASLQETPAVSHPVNVGYADLVHIIELLRASSQFSEFRLKAGELELEVRRGPAGAAPQAAAAVPLAAPAPVAPQPAPAAAAAPAPVPPPATPATPGARTHSARAVQVKAPMVGTFYAAPEPGAEPFVRPGQSVGAGDTVCIIEVMKLMNTLPAGCEGVVAEILVEDGQPVEYGQTIMVIEPR
jgi:acetyl-CoA carboxylase biotin carboxyl carrier protein